MPVRNNPLGKKKSANRKRAVGALEKTGSENYDFAFRLFTIFPTSGRCSFSFAVVTQ
jgi:hypothetical protein